MTALITAKKLFKVYGQAPNQTIALNDTSLAINKGEFVAIIGPSGSGKSTLMHILGCLDKPDKGEYYLDGKQISKLSQNELAQIRNKQIGFVFQSFNLLPRTSALKNVELPLVYAGIGKKERQEIASKLLAEVGLKEKLQSTPSQLSGGQQQRVAIARALACNPSVIFTDEPTGNLDTKSSLEIMNILKDLNKKGRTIILITHEMEIARLTKRIVTVRDGKIVSDKEQHTFRHSERSLRLEV